MNISFILPARNNLKYLKWSYESIRKNQGNHTVQICVADDASTDGTREWLENAAAIDRNLSYIINESGSRLGHTILYDRLINEVAIYDLCLIFHADMYLCPGALDAIQTHMYTGMYKIDVGDSTINKMSDMLDNIQESFNANLDKDKMREAIIATGFPYTYDECGHANLKTIVSLTRIEPPLHPTGPEKIIRNFGVEPEEFDESKFLEWFKDYRSAYYGPATTEGVFAPWAFWKSEFQEIGGHDPIFAPQSKEDSDIFNRFMLNGTKFIQTWEGYVYHMTCRGSRFNPTLTTPGTNSDEWKRQNKKSTREFIRKWGSFVKHDEYLNPIVIPKYNIAFLIDTTDTIQPLKYDTEQILDIMYALEPWCSLFITGSTISDNYILKHQSETSFDLKEKFNGSRLTSGSEEFIEVEINLDTIYGDFTYITLLPQIIEEQCELNGVYEIGGLRIKAYNLTQYQNDLIIRK